jgi:hypothetical protein
MQSQVYPAFGSSLVDAGVSAGLASALLLVLYALKKRIDTPREFAEASGVSYALLCLAVYGIPRYVHDAFASGVFTFEYFFWTITFVVPSMAVQCGIPLYIFATRGNIGALVGFFATTIITFWGLLSTGGESDVLLLYAFVMLPFSIIIVSLAAGVDFAARRVANRVGS